MLDGMSQQIAIRLPNRDLDALDAAVAERRYPTRAAAVRAGVELLLREERDRRIAEEYRRAYGEQPEDPWVGEAGLRLGAEAIRREESSPERASD